MLLPPQVPGAEFVGTEACAECHEDLTRSFATATHARLIAPGTNAVQAGCESCHGPGSLHVQSGGDVHAIVNHKIRDNEYDHILDSTTNRPPSGDRYPAYLTDQDFKTDDVNFRVTWRPWTGLSLVSRYDFQLSTIESTFPRLREIESAETTSHILSETISFTPVPRLNVQASISYALDQTDTPANDLTGDAKNLVLNSENDFWNASLLIAFALNAKTDLQAQYFYYRADNYLNNAAVSVPYDSGAEEHGVTATLIRQITNGFRWTLKYGFFTNNDETFGGFKDYTAHLVYSSIQYRF